MKGYKAFNSDMTCRGFHYEVGKTYEIDGEISLCNMGFHFCKSIADCFNYYNKTDSRFAEVEAIGEIIEGDDKCVTNKISIIKEISHDEAVRMSNTGNCNTGNRNTGNWNTGNWNTGNWNTGNWNTGDGNTGNWNTGNWNTGDWNTIDNSSGCFNTEEQKIVLFNKQSSITLKEWRSSNAYWILRSMPQTIDVIDFIQEYDMTEEEKESNPTYKTIGGYLKVSKSNESKQIWWDNLTEAQRNLVREIPNYDPFIFKKCTGIIDRKGNRTNEALHSHNPADYHPETVIVDDMGANKDVLIKIYEQ